MFALTVMAALVLAAPPPKPVDKTGRITLWIGDKIESFLPDGTDHTTIPAPDVKEPIREVICLTSKRKLAANLESRSNGRNAKSDLKLVVIPLDDYGKRYTLTGYVATTLVPSADGSKIYFNGCEGEEVDKDKAWSKGFVFDIESRKVEPIPLPEDHVLRAVSPDGKSYVTHGYDKAKTSFKTYLIADGGKPVEILQENVSATDPTFSNDGSKLLMETIDRSKLAMGPQIMWEIVVLDVASRATKTVRDFPDSGRPRTYVWSPNGTQIACLWRGLKDGGGPAGGGARVGRGGKFEYQYKVFVADIDGDNRKEIYKMDLPDTRVTDQVFMWK